MSERKECVRCLEAPISISYAGKGEEIDLQNAQSRGIAVGHALSEPKASETTFQSAFADPSYPPSAIITADRFSRSFEASRHPEEGFKDETARARAEAAARRTHYEAFMAWGKENRYPIVGVSWVLSMGIALGLVGRSPYLSTQQKLVQARVYAQTLTIGVLIASAVFEVGDRGREEGRWETVKIVDPKDPEHRHLIDKKVHKEAYQGEDQWKGESISVCWSGVGSEAGCMLIFLWRGRYGGDGGEEGEGEGGGD